MTRKTVNLPESTDHAIRESALPGESYSATTVRLVEAGVKSEASGIRRPRYVASGQGPHDLARLAEEYLRNPVPVE